MVGVRELLFWLLVGGIAYTYAGYPLLLWCLARLRPRAIHRADFTPDLTVIVTAFNEEKSIGRKLEGLLAQDYPAPQLDILVASDGSWDGTEEIVRSFADRGVRLLRVPGRVGKTETQNRAVREAHGELLVFTDATTRLDPGAIRNVACNFADPAVGCAIGHLSYVPQDSRGVGSGATSYWKYERLIKQWESGIGSLTGATGCFYAVRKSVYREIDPGLISDFVVALNTYEAGYRVIYDQSVLSYEQAMEDPRREFGMRVRVALRSYWALWNNRRLLNPLRHGLFSVQLISHKLLRYAVPLFLLGLVVVNVSLIGDPLYACVLFLQSIFYLSALTIHLGLTLGLPVGPLSKPYYFVLANLAALVALLKFARGERIVSWTPLR